MRLPFPSRQNLWSLPAGISPGNDPSHIAWNSQMRYSGVAHGAAGGFISLFPGGQTATVGTVTGAELPIIGPTAKITASSSYMKHTLATINETINSCTFAAIFQPSTTIGNGVIFASNGNNGSGGVFFEINNLNLNLVIGGTNIQDTNVVLTTGVPYFIAMTYKTPNGTSLYVNLATGKVIYGTVNVSSSATASSASQYNIGGTTAANIPMDGSLAALMYSANLFLTRQQMIEWSADPWGFWYPQYVNRLLSASTGAPGANGGNLRNRAITGVGL